MKKLAALSIVAAMFVGFTTPAQTTDQTPKTKDKQLTQMTKETAQERADKLTKKMVSTLELNATQEKQVADINLQYAQKNEDAFKANKDDKSAAKTALKKLQTEKNEKLKVVFTADQYTKWTEKQKEMKDKMQGKKHKTHAKTTNNEVK